MYDEQLTLAQQIAKEAGDIMRRYFLSADHEWKDDATPLTIADTTINTMVIDRITEVYPEHSILGEEESKMQDSEFTWVCDPVDGTMAFSHGLPISTFSLALCLNGVPVVGVIYDPFSDRIFSAAQGAGAFCNAKSIAVNSLTMEQHPLVDVEASFKSILPFTQSLEQLLHNNGIYTTHLWSAILPGALTASGEFSGMIFCVEKPEDGAALRVIVEEAGGKVTDFDGNDQRYDQATKGFVVSNGIIHDDLLKYIKEAAA